MASNSKLNLAPVLAHRGASGYAPENTLVAMRKAKRLGAQWVEFDVMLAAGTEPIIIHDATLNRTTNSRGAIAETPYSEISQLDAGSWFAPEFRNERIPTLVELLACLQALNLHFNMEIKPIPGQELATTQQALHILQQHWPCEKSPPLISSASLLCLREAQRLHPELLLGVIADRWPSHWQAISAELSCISWHFNHKILTPERVREMQRAEKLVLAYTVNEADRALELFRWGVAAVFTDYPDVILQALREEKIPFPFKGEG
jgi:glycerophosphoryl diester phosphodiesterase